MAKKLVKYSVVDAFTDKAFKGNPAAVCLLEEERDEQWLQAVAAEFNISETCYLTRLTESGHIDSSIPRFRLRWFTPVTEVELCGHATLAAAHALFTSGLVNSNIIEFVTLSGVLTARKVTEIKTSGGLDIQNGETQEGFFIELDFPTVPLTDFSPDEVSLISNAVNGVTVHDIKITTTSSENLFLVLPSRESVVELQPEIDAIKKCPGKGLIISAAAPPGSEFDFYSRYFCPKLGINEDPVCGSAHCALAPYWSKKLRKCDFVANAASPRGGVVNIHLDEQNQRVLLRGKAVIDDLAELEWISLFLEDALSELSLSYTTGKQKMESRATNWRFPDPAKKPVEYHVLVLPSRESVVELQPEIDVIKKCPGKGLIISAAAPPGSEFDFYSRYFCPKLGINEDPVGGSAHCALAPYWSKKLGKCDFVANADDLAELEWISLFLENTLSELSLSYTTGKQKMESRATNRRFPDPAKKPVEYHVVDAFTDTAFGGNPAAVCLLEEERDDQWLQAVAAEFNIPTTCYLTRLTGSDPLNPPIPRFHLRWFTPVAEVKICGHATLAAAHTLFATSLINSNTVEFLTASGILTARKVPEIKTSSGSTSIIQNDESQESFFIELDFPTIPVTDFDPTEFSSISKALNAASVIDIKRTTTEDDLIVILPSGQDVAELQPQFDALGKCPGRGIIVSGAAPPESGFDYYSRFFCPKFKVNEDHVCGSANCALAPYWSKKLGKCDFVAYWASARGGIVKIHLDEQNQRVLMQGKAVSVMEGSLLV